MKTLQTLILVFFITTCSAQYVGPPPVSLKFRIYGKDASPVRLTDYKVKVRAGHIQLNPGDFKQEKGFIESKETFFFWNRNFRSGKTDTITIISPSGDSMNIYMKEIPDSIPYQKGEYFIPGEFSPLLKIKKKKGIFIGQFWSMFEGKDENPRLNWKSAVDSVEFGRKGYLQLVNAPDHSWIMAFSIYSPAFFSISYDLGAAFTELKINIPKNELVYEVCPVSPDQLFVLTQDDKKKRKNVYRFSIPAGNIELDTFLTKINCTSVSFAPDGKGYASGSHSGKKKYLLRTDDYGENWKMEIDELEGDLFKVSAFPSGEIILRDNYYPRRTWYKQKGSDWTVPGKNKAYNDDYVTGSDGRLARITHHYGRHEETESAFSILERAGWREIFEGLTSFNQFATDHQTGEMIIVGTDYFIRSSDGGYSWTYYGCRGPYIQAAEDVYYHNGILVLLRNSKIFRYKF